MSLWARLLHNLQGEEFQATGVMWHFEAFLRHYSVLCAAVDAISFKYNVLVVVLVALKPKAGLGLKLKHNMLPVETSSTGAKNLSVPHVLEPPADGTAQRAEGCGGFLAGRGQRL